MGKHLNSVYTSIYDWIMTHGEGKIYFLSDFNSYEPDSVRQTFVRLVNDGVVIRLSPGIFLFPVKTRFGIAYPSDYEIAKEIVNKGLIENAVVIQGKDTLFHVMEKGSKNQFLSFEKMEEFK